jgi:hypothetical protein
MSDRLSTAGGMVIDANGRVTYDFAGHVHATGLDLDYVASGPVTAPNMIRWLDPAGASKVAAWGTIDGTSGLPTLMAFAGGAGLVGLLDGAGASDFLRIARDAATGVRRNVMLDFGVKVLNAGGGVSAVATVPHALGRTPLAAVAGSDNGGLNAAAFNFNAGTLDVALQHINATGWNTNQTVYWIAVG